MTLLKLTFLLCIYIRGININEYIKRLLRNASDSYIRFALSTGHYADKIKEEKDKMTELLENGELKKVEKSLDVYFKLLARAVNEERGMNE